MNSTSVSIPRYSHGLATFLALVLLPCPLLSARDFGGVIEKNITWRAADSPVRLTNGVTVPDGITLTIEAGTAIHLAAGVDLLVTNGGRLLAEGTLASPIRFTPVPGSDTRWGGIIVCGDEGSPETRIAHAYIEGNNFSAIYSPGGTLMVEHVRFGSPDRQYMSLDQSSFVVRDCHFPAGTGRFELLHGNLGIKPGGRGIVQRCFFGGTLGYSDVMDFRGGNRDREQPIVHFINNVFAGSSDDGLDLDGTDAWVEGNIFLHVHKNGTPDTASGISGGNHRRLTSEITAIGNIFFDCDQAATAKQGNFFAMIHNTIVHMTKKGGEDYASGAICVRDTEPELTTFGEGIYMEANIVAEVEQLARNYAKGETAVHFVNNLLPMAWEGPGKDNFVGDPKLKRIPKIEETQFTNWTSAQILREWLSPASDSPARGKAAGGRDLGAVNPMGVSISGEPRDETDQTSATLTIGPNRKGSGIPETGWPLGVGYTHYKWRRNGGDWSVETPIDQPISLANLASGEHRVEVIGKRDTGLYQNDPAFGPDAVVSRSRSWIVRAK